MAPFVRVLVRKEVTEHSEVSKLLLFNNVVVSYFGEFTICKYVYFLISLLTKTVA